jgi:exopolysaccharide/PEP-CTERM locus tyrosine autokinase
MSQNPEKDEARATITDLVASSETEKNSFFRDSSVDKIPDLASPEAEKIFVQDRLRSLNMLVSGSELGPHFSDEYRRIKRPLLSNAFGKSAALVENGNLILVTSSIPGEGKTFTAINLALSIANERDHTVLLVDCDVTMHQTSEILGIADKPGLVDVLENDSFSVGEAILRTDVPELCLISAGKQHDFVTELLASQKMADLVKEIGERYTDRVIIFDSPPLLSTPQTQVLAELVGQVVFVIEAGKTPQELVEEALEMIPEDQATGLVMNKSEGISSRSGYYYSYYGTEKK